MTYPTGGQMGADATIGDRSADHPADGPGVDYGVPARYGKVEVPDQPALINPSAGDIGPPGGGVNPVGEQVAPGSMGPVSTRQVYPDTSVG
jgi:hypothetical protein